MSSLAMLSTRLIAACIIALALPPAAAVAQGVPGVTVVATVPGPLVCKQPVPPAPQNVAYSVTHGLVDNFAPPVTGLGADPLPTPSAAITSAGWYVASTNRFDQPATLGNYPFGDSFTIAIPAGSTIGFARVITRLRASAGDAPNDTVSLRTAGQTLSYSLVNISGTGTWQQPDPARIFVFNLTGAFLTALNSASAPVVDFILQDDTRIDFVRLDICYTTPPPPRPDIAAQKSKTPTGYNLVVNNPGPAIPAGSTIEVAEYVQQGLTVTGYTAPGWTCTPSAPVVGPDVITCKRNTPFAANASLPPIQLTTTGGSHCPNCMRVRLWKLTVVQEANTANNLSCVQ